MIGDVVAAIFIVAIIYLLVKPGSASTEFIRQFSTALTAIVANAADLANTEDIQEEN